MENDQKLWRRINWLLVVLIVTINLYIVLAPFEPRLRFWLDKRHAKATSGLPYKTQLAAEKNGNHNRSNIPQDSRIVIPKLALNEHIYTGASPYLMNKGVWARPNTSIPAKGSNTVLVGHRFNYSAPATFYNLDKLKKGDTLVVYWAGKEFDYKVTDSKIVPPSATQVELPTKNSRLTLYTCTPMWTAKNRLVVIADLIKATPS